MWVLNEKFDDSDDDRASSKSDLVGRGNGYYSLNASIARV